MISLYDFVAITGIDFDSMVDVVSIGEQHIIEYIDILKIISSEMNYFSIYSAPCSESILKCYIDRDGLGPHVRIREIGERYIDASDDKVGRRKAFYIITTVEAYGHFCLIFESRTYTYDDIDRR